MKEKSKEIVIIGPVYPYKGGISHYTGLLYRAMSKKYNVTMMSYSMQYPKILFKKEQRDYTNDSFRVEDARFEINTANPFNWLHVAAQINRLDPELVIMEWWHPYFAPCYYILAHAIRAKILFTCHNVFPHERFPLDRFLTRLVLKQGDSFILHAKAEADELRTIRKDANYLVNVHPTYNAFCFEHMSSADARQRLGLDEKERVLLFFGFVRPYKGLRHLLNAIRILKESDFGVKLLIVGDFGGAKEEYQSQIKENGIADCTLIHDEYTPDREVEKYFASADLVVLPYESATQSGIVQIAYGFTKPVVVTNVGGLPEVVEDRKTGFIVEPQNPKMLAEAIREYYEECDADELRKHIKEAEYHFSWDRMVESIEKLQDWK